MWEFLLQFLIHNIWLKDLYHYLIKVKLTSFNRIDMDKTADILKLASRIKNYLQLMLMMVIKSKN